MAGLFGYLAAGAAESVGTGIVEQAKAKREAALRMLEEDRGFERLQQRDAETRAFTAGENKLQRDAAAEQARLAREADGETVTDADGNSYYRPGGSTELKPLTSGGKQVKTATGSKFEIDRRYQMLTAAGVDPKRAALIAAGDKPPTSAEVEKMVEAAVKTEFAGGMGKPKQDELEASRTRNRERITRNLGLSEQSDDSREQAPDKPSSTGEAPASTSGRGDRPATDAMPSGTGTKESPFKAETQAHIDWFKKSAQPGDVLSVDGKLYVK